MAEDTPEFSAILKVLASNNVEFIVVGGVCAILLGAILREMQSIDL